VCYTRTAGVTSIMFFRTTGYCRFAISVQPPRSIRVVVTSVIFTFLRSANYRPRKGGVSTHCTDLSVTVWHTRPIITALTAGTIIYACAVRATLTSGTRTYAYPVITTFTAGACGYTSALITAFHRRRRQGLQNGLQARLQRNHNLPTPQPNPRTNDTRLTTNTHPQNQRRLFFRNGTEKNCGFLSIVICWNLH